jgi:hypothetical protein
VPRRCPTSRRRCGPVRWWLPGSGPAPHCLLRRRLAHRRLAGRCLRQPRRGCQRRPRGRALEAKAPLDPRRWVVRQSAVFAGLRLFAPGVHGGEVPEDPRRPHGVRARRPGRAAPPPRPQASRPWRFTRGRLIQTCWAAQSGGRETAKASICWSSGRRTASRSYVGRLWARTRARCTYRRRWATLSLGEEGRRWVTLGTGRSGVRARAMSGDNGHKPRQSAHEGDVGRLRARTWRRCAQRRRRAHQRSGGRTLPAVGPTARDGGSGPRTAKLRGTTSAVSTARGAHTSGQEAACCQRSAPPHGMAAAVRRPHAASGRPHRTGWRQRSSDRETARHNVRCQHRTWRAHQRSGGRMPPAVGSTARDGGSGQGAARCQRSAPPHGMAAAVLGPRNCEAQRPLSAPHVAGRSRWRAGWSSGRTTRQRVRWRMKKPTVLCDGNKTSRFYATGIKPHGFIRRE